MAPRSSAGSAAFALELAIQVEDTAVQNTLARFLAVMQKDIKDVLPDQARLLTRDLVKLTPPFVSRAATSESFNIQRKTGEKAVRRDILRVFQPLDAIVRDNQVLGPAIKKAMAKNDLAVLGFGTSLPELLVSAGVLKTPDPSRIVESVNLAALLSARKARGRVPVAAAGRALFVKSRGAVAQLIKTNVAKVGRAKGGWATAAAAFKLNLPNWITRHKSGDVQDVSGALINPYIRISNAVSYMIEQNQMLRITLYALQDRNKAMTRQIAAVVAKQKL